MEIMLPWPFLPDTAEAPAKPESPPPVSVESWSLSIEEIFNNTDLRLDATHFDPKTAGTIKELQKSGVELRPLSDFAAWELRNQFTSDMGAGS